MRCELDVVHEQSQPRVVGRDSFAPGHQCHELLHAFRADLDHLGQQLRFAVHGLEKAVCAQDFFLVAAQLRHDQLHEIGEQRRGDPDDPGGPGVHETCQGLGGEAVVDVPEDGIELCREVVEEGPPRNADP